MLDKCITKIDKKIIENDNDIKSDTYKKTIKLFNMIMEYIIENNLFLFGGFAINTYLPKNKKIYDDNIISDLDCYCLDPKLESKKLSNLISEKGYKYVEVKQSTINLNVYKIFVEFIPVCDFNIIKLEDYNTYLEMNKHKKINGFNVLPKEILKFKMLRELSNPNTSMWRWEKIYDRYTIFLSVFKDNFKSTKTKKMYPTEEINIKLNLILKYIKDEQIPLLGTIGYELHKYKKINKNYILNSKDTFIEILILNSDGNKFINYINKNITNINIINNNTEIIIEYKNIYLLKIYKINNECISYCNINGYRVISLYGIQSYLYKNYIDNYFIKNNTNNYLISEIYKLIKGSNCIEDCLLSTECYGKSIDIVQLRKNIWNEKFI